MFQLLFFLPESPMLILFVVGVAFLLFGSAKLPQLARSIGQSKKAFKEGMEEAERDDQIDAQKRQQIDGAPQVSSVSDEQLMAELRRRAAEKQAVK